MSARLHQTEAIIIKKKNWGEADRLLTIYSRDLGKMKLKACGVRKANSKRSPYLEIFNHVNLTVFRGKSGDTLSGVSPGDLINTDLNLVQISYMYYLCELVEALTAEHAPHFEIFDLLRNALNLMRKTEDRDVLHTQVTEFAIKLLTLLGFLPQRRNIDFNLDVFVESLIERRLKTRIFLTKVV